MRTRSGILSLVILLLGVTASAEQRVEVAGTTVTLKCPLKGTYSWFKMDKPETVIDGEDKETYNITDYTESNNGKYECRTKEDRYQFYIRAKVCKDCIDLSTGTVIGIICADLLVTLLVAVSVYCFAKRRGASKDFLSLPHVPDEIPSTRPSDMTSPQQNAHYAPIKGGQRDVYDKLQRNY